MKLYLDDLPNYMDWNKIYQWLIDLLIASIIAFIIIILLGGCTATRKIAIRVSEEEYTNYEISKEMAQTYLLFWHFQSGMIREGLKDEIPVSVKETMDNLDKWASLPTIRQTDEILGRVLIARFIVLSETMKVIMDKYVPGLFQFLLNMR